MKKVWEAFTQDSFSGWWAIRDVEDGLEVGSCDGGFEREDARLMAAAPELLAALSAVCNAADNIGGEHVTGLNYLQEAVVQGYAAIEKATGK